MWWLLLSIGRAFAQDDGLDDLDDEIDIGESPEPAPKTPNPAPKAEPDAPAPPDDADDNDDGLDAFRDTDDDEDLLGDEGKTPTSGDSEQVYRAALAKLSKFEPDEELAGWEAYLAQYPASVFRTRIENRMEELTDLMYASPIDGPGDGTVDANKAELLLAQGLQIENIDPRTRLQLGFEMGLPNYLNLVADYEHALSRQFSFHGGVRHRYMGYNIEAGVHYAFVKSLRTKMLVTLIGDLHYNTIPAYPGLRPQLAIGKRFGHVDAQIQGGADLTYRQFTNAAGAPASTLQPSIIGGASLFYGATEQVGLFVETSTYMKSVAPDGAFAGGMYRFNVASFGLKFFPGKTGNQEVNVGATLPYMQQWWQFHYGSIMAQYNFYPKI